MTKTEQKLLTRMRFHGGSIYLDGKREVDAAKRLVKLGLAAKFENYSSMSGGDYYIHPFTRRAGVTKPKFVYAGKLWFQI